MQISYSLATINQAADSLLQSLHQYRVWCFSGDMGAGKTTLITAICNLLKTEDPVSSPTFSIINEYRYKAESKEKIIYHMDLYRLKDAAEAVSAGVEEALDTGDICLVEWAENAPELFEGKVMHIVINTTGEGTRMLTASPGFTANAGF